MKKYILFLFAAVSCLQTNAQVMEVWNGSTKCLACKNDDTYKYTAEAYYNSKDYFQVKDKDGNVVDDYGNTSSYTYTVRIYNKTCMWGSVPTKDQAVDIGQTWTDETTNKTYKVLWAPWNLGADSYEDRGVYFAWGEVGTEYAYETDNVTTAVINHNEVIGKRTDTSSTTGKGYVDKTWKGQSTGTTMDDAHDAAVQWWGNGWQTPTEDMLEWLVNHGEWAKVTSFGTDALNYYNFTNNSQTLTFNRSGYRDGTGTTDTSGGTNKLFLQSRTKNKRLAVYESWGSTTCSMTTKTGEASYYNGVPIRPVMLVETTTTTSN